MPHKTNIMIPVQQTPATSLAKKYAEQGRWYYESSNYLEAINACDQALKLGKLDKQEESDCYYYRGFSYLIQKDYQAALNDFKVSSELSLDEDDFDIKINIAICHYMLQNIDLALSMFKKLYKLKAKQIAVLQAIICVNLGQIYFKKNEFDKALNYYLEAEIIDSEYVKNLNIHIEIGLIYKEQHKFIDAISNLKKAAGLAQNNESIAEINQEISECYFALIDFIENSIPSETVANNVAMTNQAKPVGQEACYNAGIKSVEEKQYKAAIGYFKEALKKSALAHRDMALVCKELGKFTEAVMFYDWCIDILVEKQIFVHAAYYYERGLIQLKRNEAAAAESDFKKAKDHLDRPDSISLADIEQYLKKDTAPIQSEPKNRTSQPPTKTTTGLKPGFLKPAALAPKPTAQNAQSSSINKIPIGGYKLRPT